MGVAIGPDGEGLAFLLGLPRSGTTLLSMMLDNHPDVASPPEPWLMLAFAEFGRVSARHPANASVLGTAVQRFAGEEGIVLAARTAGRALYDAHLKACQKRILVDKTPRYCLIPEFLHEVFPRARFIWLRRDPMDIAASYNTTWGFDLSDILKQGTDVPELFDLTIGLERLSRFHENHPDVTHVVFYEHLAVAPREELAAVLRHLGLEATSVLLDSLTELDASKRASEEFGDPKIRGTTAPHTNSIGSWRHVLNHAQLQVILDTIGAERLVHLGYRDTLASLEEIGISPGGNLITSQLRATAAARLAVRQADMIQSTTHDYCQCREAAPREEATLTTLLTAKLRRLGEIYRGSKSDHVSGVPASQQDFSRSVQGKRRQAK